MAVRGSPRVQAASGLDPAMYAPRSPAPAAPNSHARTRISAPAARQQGREPEEQVGAEPGQRARPAQPRVRRHGDCEQRAAAVRLPHDDAAAVGGRELVSCRRRCRTASDLTPRRGGSPPRWVRSPQVPAVMGGRGSGEAGGLGGVLTRGAPGGAGHGAGVPVRVEEVALLQVREHGSAAGVPDDAS
jgi:hypothetical protein